MLLLVRGAAVVGAVKLVLFLLLLSLLLLLLLEALVKSTTMNMSYLVFNCSFRSELLLKRTFHKKNEPTNTNINLDLPSWIGHWILLRELDDDDTGAFYPPFLYLSFSFFVTAKSYSIKVNTQLKKIEKRRACQRYLLIEVSSAVMACIFDGILASVYLFSKFNWFCCIICV